MIFTVLASFALLIGENPTIATARPNPYALLTRKTRTSNWVEGKDTEFKTRTGLLTSVKDATTAAERQIQEKRSTASEDCLALGPEMPPSMRAKRMDRESLAILLEQTRLLEMEASWQHVSIEPEPVRDREQVESDDSSFLPPKIIERTPSVDYEAEGTRVLFDEGCDAFDGGHVVAISLPHQAADTTARESRMISLSPMRGAAGWLSENAVSTTEAPSTGAHGALLERVRAWLTGGEKYCETNEDVYAAGKTRRVIDLNRLKSAVCGDVL